MYAWNSSQGGPDPDDARGVSEVLGIVLVLGMVIAATVVIVTVGATSFQQSQEQVTMESAVTSMEELNRRILQVASQSSGQASVTLPDIDGADLRVEKESGWMNISFINKTGTEVDKSNIRLGKIIYETEDQSVAIQAGGVWRTNKNTNDNSTAIITNPSFNYRYLNGEPTLSTSIVQIDNVGIDGDTVNIGPIKKSSPKLTEISPIQSGEWINITVQSEYYKAWGELFEKRTKQSIIYTDSQNKATLRLKGPKSSLESVGGALIAPESSGTASNANIIDSYNSSQGPYTTTQGSNAFVGIGDDYDVSNAVEIQGDLHLGGDLTTSNTLEVWGETRVAGNAEITNADGFGMDEGDWFAIEGDLEYVKNGVPFGGDIIVGGDMKSGTNGFNGETNGNISVKGVASLNKHAVVDGGVTVGSELHYKRGASVAGSIHSNGNVVFEGKSLYSGPEVVAEKDILLQSSKAEVNANVTTEGDILIKYDGKIKGNLKADGDITLGGKSKIVGDIQAGGNVTIEGYDAEIDGDVTTGGEVRFEKKGTINGDVTARRSTNGDNYAVDVDSWNAKIDGNVVSGEKVQEGAGSITGSIEEDKPLSSISVTADSRTPKSPPSPDIPGPDPVTTEINNMDSELSSNVYSGPIEGGDCTGTCTLEAGDYHMEEFSIANGERAVLDTRDGDIRIYVENGIHIKGEVVIKGDNIVRMYADEDLTIESSSANVWNPGQNARQLRIYMKPTATFEMMSGHPEFTGVVYGPGTPSNSGVSLVLSNQATVFGGLVGHPSGISNAVNIHYDEALDTDGQEQELKKDFEPGRIVYIHLTSIRLQ